MGHVVGIPTVRESRDREERDVYNHWHCYELTILGFCDACLRRDGA